MWMTMVGSPFLVAAATVVAFAQPTNPIPAGDRESILHRIAADEAAPRIDGTDPAVARAVNRRSNLRAEFRSGSATLTTFDSGAAAATLRTATIGRRNGSRLEIGSVAPRIDASGRVVFEHDGVVEWWKSDVRGLEQGFTLATRPEGEGELVVEVTIDDSRFARIGTGGRLLDLVEFDASSARETARLRLKNLHAFDRDGDSLPVRFDATATGYTIVVDDRDAEYPLTIDPLASAPSFDVEGDFTDAQFGISIAPAGDVNGDGFSDLVIGASNFSGGLAFEGKVYVYHGSASGLSASSAWEASGGQANAYFGRVVAAAGDVNDDGFSDVAISAQLYDDDQTNEGRVFVYLGSGSGLALAAATVVDGNQAEGQFGSSLAAAGDVDGDGDSELIIGSPVYDFGGVGNSGIVAVFPGEAGGVNTTPVTILGGTQFDGRQGQSVAGVGDVNADGFADISYGALLHDDDQVDEGLVAVHHGSGSGLSTTAATTVFGNQTSAQLGTVVAGAGDVNADGYSDVLVGAPLFDFGNVDEGRAFLFPGSASGVASTASWTSESDQTNARHGNAVASAGDADGDGFSDVVVASFLWDDTLTDQGRVAFYSGSATGLSTTIETEILGSQSSGFFGQSLAFAGDVNGDGLSDVAIGAQAFTNGESSEGRVVVHHGEVSLPPEAFQWAAKGGQIGAEFGVAAAFAGDLNGDGFDDVAFGAPRATGPKVREGRIDIHYGAATGLTPAFGFRVFGENSGDSLGSAIARLGDIDGDGYDDLGVGLPGHDADQPNVGAIKIFYGGSGGLSDSRTEQLAGDEKDALFGVTIAGVGDVDGDGFVDLVIGSPNSSTGIALGGGARFYRGGASGVASSPSWTRDGLSASGAFGFDATPLGDVDADGFADFAISAPSSGGGLGSVEIYHGSSSGPNATPDLSISGVTSGGSYGVSIAGVGDVNGDGFSDAVFGALNTIRVHHGSGAGFLATPDTTVTGVPATGQFGIEVAMAGDLNRDGFSDVFVGAPLQFVDQVTEGAAYVFPGSSSGLATTAIWSDEGDQTNSGYGATLSGGGDVDGDGTGDLLVCAPEGENGFNDEGRGFVYYGNGAGGSARGSRPRTLRSDSTAPIAHLGRSFADTFRVDVLARSAFGRSPLTPQVEIKAAAVAFDGTGLTNGTEVDTGTSGATTNVSSASLADGAYRFRSRFVLDTSTIPYQPTTPWVGSTENGPQEPDRNVGAAAAVLIVDPKDGLEVEHFVGDTDPTSDVVEVANLGSGNLGFTVSENPAVSWLAVTPTSGAGIVAGGIPQTLSFDYSPTGLTPGVYSTDVTIANSTVPTDAVVIPVTLVVSNQRFVPGDRLLATFDGPGDFVVADFDAVVGETLKLEFDPVATAFKLGISIRDEANDVVVNTSVKLLTSGVLKTKYKLDRSGRLTLRMTCNNGAAGSAISVLTKAKFPALAKTQSLDLTVKSGQTKNVKFLAVPNAVLQFTLDGQTTGPFTLLTDTPDGNQLDLTDLIETQGDGSLKVSGVFLDESGQYKLKITNGNAKKANLSVLLEPEQPIGTSTIALP